MRQEKTPLIILFILSCSLYFNTLNHEYVLDDFSVIKDNFLVKRGVEGIGEIWKTHYRYGYGYQQASLYRPLSLTLFALQWEVAPDNPSFAHACNILLYSLLILVLYLFLIELFGKNKQFLAFISCALFLAHPIHTEVVANIKSVDEILVFLFSISAYLFLFSYLKNNSKKTHLAISLSFILLAFFSKENTVTMIGLIPFMLVLFKEKSWLNAFKISSLYIIPFFIYMVARFQVIGSLTSGKTIARIDNLLVSAPSEIVRISTALKIMLLYLWKLIVPTPLISDYSFKYLELNGIDNLYTWLSILLYTALVVAIIKWWNKNRIIVFSILFFLITFILYSNLFLTIGTAFGERLLFIPSLGFCVAIGYFIHKFLRINTIREFSMKKAGIKAIVPIVLLCLYSYKTIDRNKAWENDLSLYSTDVEVCYESARCQYHYGIALMKYKSLNATNENDRIRALKESTVAFKRAIEILPTYSDAYADLGLANYRLKNYAEGEQAYLQAIKLNKSNATAYSNLGSLYFNTGRYELAKNSYLQAVQINPNHIDATANLASTLGTLGDFNSAITYFKKAIAINPNEPNYYQMIGVTYQNLGNTAQANIWLQKAKQLSQK